MGLAKAYIGTIVAFLIVDAVWIGLVVRDYYQDTVGQLLRDTPNYLAAGLFYLAYAAGIIILAVSPALKKRDVRIALGNGAVLGAIAYGTYTLTNFSVLKGWTIGLVVSDIVWGAFLTALSAGCGYLFARDSAAR